MKTYTAPASWASAILNLDYSGLEPDEVKRLNEWLLSEGLSFKDCLGWLGRPFTGQFSGIQTNLLEYMFK